MAQNISNIMQNITEYPNTFVRQGAYPLEAYSYFNSKAEAEEYARNNPIAYVGQPIAIKETLPSV